MEAVNINNCFAKIGIQGGTGSGKTTTAGLLLLALSVTKHDRAPVLVRDSEPGWHFIKPMFDAEKVPLIIEAGRDFMGMHASLRRAIKEGCCGFATDSISHPWQEIMERFADSTGRVPFHKWNQIKPLWNEWVVDFMNAPLHAIACGRLGFEYFYQEAEDGRLEAFKGDSRMKAGGSESFGYEPHLTCEMNRFQKRKRNRIEKVQYGCLVLKDRSRAVNGKEFFFDDLSTYRKGGYAKVLEAFQPHIEALEKVSGVTLSKQTSAPIIPQGNTEASERDRERSFYLSEIKERLIAIWPGTDAASRQHKITVIKALFDFASWEAVEQKVALYKLDAGLERVKKLSEKIEGSVVSPSLMSRQDLLDLLNGSEKTLVDLVTKSVEKTRQESSPIGGAA